MSNSKHTKWKNFLESLCNDKKMQMALSVAVAVVIIALIVGLVSCNRDVTPSDAVTPTPLSADVATATSAPENDQQETAESTDKPVAPTEVPADNEEGNTTPAAESTAAPAEDTQQPSIGEDELPPVEIPTEGTEQNSAQEPTQAPATKPDENGPIELPIVPIN